jgi:3-hydroxy-5-methyl-1-naphthoate 3-O-methyltransferase
MSEDTDIVAEMEGMLTGFAPAVVLFAAVELGLFELLAVPRTLPELATLTHAEAVGGADRGTSGEDGLRRLLVVLQQLGLVRLADEQVEATARGRALCGDSPAARGFRAVAHHHHRHVVPPLLELATAVRTGRPQHATWQFARQRPDDTPYEALLREPREYELFAAAMDRGSVGLGERISRLVDLQGCRRLLDVGCGGGVVARELLAARPSLLVHSVDLPAACAYAQARTNEAPAELRARHRIQPWDVFGELPFPDEPGEVVLLSAILGDFAPPDRARLLARVATLLAPGGRLVIAETLLDDDRSGPPKAALFSLLMLAATQGDQLSERDLRELLGAAGFVVLDVLGRGEPGRQIVVARREDAVRTLG